MFSEVFRAFVIYVLIRKFLSRRAICGHKQFVIINKYVSAGCSQFLASSLLQVIRNTPAAWLFWYGSSILKARILAGSGPSGPKLLGNKPAGLPWEKFSMHRCEVVGSLLLQVLCTMRLLAGGSIDNVLPHAISTRAAHHDITSS